VAQPDVSVVIPVYNEEGILRDAVAELLEGFETVRTALRYPEMTFEVILAENGSSDRTAELAARLASENPEIRTFSLGEPNYGKALRRGILEAHGTFVICEEIDLCDRDFHRRALAMLMHADADLVVGSKAMKGSSDERPAFRRLATKVINGMLRVAVDFRGTDTHGLKAFRRTALLDTVRACLVEKDVFASEFVIRADRGGVRTKEIPVHIIEKRPPSINLFKRVPNVLKSIAKLTYAIRIRG